MHATEMVDHAETITQIIVYDDLKIVPSVQEISSRIERLEASFFLLRCHVADAMSSKPRFTESDGPAVKVAQIPVDHIDVQELLQREINDDAEVTATGPRLWRVRLYQTDVSVALALTINHIITDGVGSHRLLNFLSDGGIPELKSTSIAPALEKTMNVKIGLPAILATVWREEVRPRIPGWLLTPNWSGPLLNDPRKRPIGHPTGCRLLRIDAVTVKRLKDLAKQHSVVTLQPVIETAFDIALWHEYNTKAFWIITPLSERDDKLGHPRITGNYFSPLVEHVKIRPEQDDFWSLARKHRKLLASQQGRRRARERVGFFTLVPASAWLKQVRKMASSPRAYKTGLMVTNLGPSLGPLEDVPSRQLWWGQPASSALFPIIANVSGDFNGDITMSVVWKEDSAIAADEVDRMLATVGRVLGRLGEESSMHELVQ